MTNFTHILCKCNHFKDTEIPSNFITVFDCPKSVTTTKAEIANQAKLYQAPMIHLEKVVGMQKKLQSEYPSYYTSDYLTKKTNPKESAISMIKELPFTFSEASQFCWSHPFLHFLSEMPVLLRCPLSDSNLSLLFSSSALGTPPSLTSPLHREIYNLLNSKG